MFESFQRHWLRLLRVPPEPAPPPGEAGVRVFRAAPRYYTWLRVKWGGSQVAALGGVIVTDMVIAQESVPWANGHLWSSIFAGFLWFTWLVQLVVTYTILRIGYEQRWYILTDRSLRVREGVLRLNEKTMTFANVQQLTVRQGPLQRLLGIADLEVRTAGGGGAAQGGHPGGGSVTSSTHTAYFRGVDNAEEIRAVIRDRIRHYRDAGLGDPDDDAHAVVHDDHPDSSALMAAARALTIEARALREALAGKER